MPLRDVRTGRVVPKPGLDRPGYRLGEAWYEVSTHHVEETDEHEVCIHHIAKGEFGGGSRGPLWPCLRVKTAAEVKKLTKEVITFARTLPDEESIYHHNEEGLDTRLRDWASSQGFTKLNRSTWTRSTS